nr:ribonuclease H-like domain-containing protein [Tanacetum cinerariifolium]
MSPKTNDSFSTVDVKIFPKSDVKDPSPTNGFPSCSFKENVKPRRNLCNKSGIVDRIHCKNNFIRTKTCFVYGSKSHLIKDCDVYDDVDNFPSIVSIAASVPAGSRKSSTSISAGRSIPAASRNRPTSIHAGRHIPAGRFNMPAPFPAGRSVPTGWTNHAARPFFRPTTLYFNNVSSSGIYDHMSMNEGRWGSAVHPHMNKNIGIVDSGCSRSMTGNKEKLANFMQVKGGAVSFGGGDRKITGKGTIRTSKIHFENVYYVEELQHFNLFSISQIYDKKNKVLFTNDECLKTRECNVKKVDEKARYYAFKISEVKTEEPKAMVHPHVYKDIGIVDSGCSRSMTGNKEKLDDFVQFKGGTVTFGGGDGKITGKGTIRTSKLNFENVYYVEELQYFNLFSVSQISDKKNKVLFTDDECLVLPKEFQLPDESQVVLRIPRRHDLYTFNLSNIQP